MTTDCIDETRLPSILVVEDDANALSLLRACLERYGYQLSSAGTLAEARRRLQANDDWGLVILDRRLPDGDGVTLCPDIRATQPHSYILMLTGEVTAEAKIEGFESGVDDYVTKPFQIEELMARIRAGMRIVELQRELLASSRRYEALSLTDSLTSLRNRRAFDQEFASRFEQARRYARPLSLVIIDLDYFKSINDQFGHSAGDGVLRGIAQILDHGTRRSDFVARIGGEEFAVLLPETSLFEALHFAEKIRSTVMSATVRTEAATHQITVSIGVANVPHSSVTTPQEFFNAADQALYRAKARGRNRIESERRKVPVREALSDVSRRQLTM